MLRAMDVAQYFLNKDPERKIFDKNLVHKDGRTFYAGNARLNKYLHMAQNLYIAKTGDRLFSDDLYAYDNGAVVPDVQEYYSVLYTKSDAPSLPGDIKIFLDRVYKFLENASLEELIELSHEDTEWERKHGYFYKPDQRMDSTRHAEEYKEQYRDALIVMERMTV